jgi:hypothetical protein
MRPGETLEHAVARQHRTRKWVSRDGRKLLASDMEPDHLTRGLKMMRRKGFVSMAEHLAAEAAGNQPTDAPQPNIWIDIFEHEINYRREKSKWSQKE